MTTGHQIADPDAPAFDTCSHCGQPIILRDGRLVTMLSGNGECYGASNDSPYVYGTGVRS